MKLRRNSPRPLVGMHSQLRTWLPPLLLMAAIFVLSSMTRLPGRELNIPHLDKLVHLMIFGLLSFLWGRTFHGGLGWSWVRSAVVAVVITSLYGITDEWHQSFTPGRTVDTADWLADTLGAILAQAISYWRHGRTPERQSS